MKVETDEGPEARLAPAKDSWTVPRETHILRRLLIIVLALCVVAGVVVFSLLPRLRDKKTVRAETMEMAIPRVSVLHPRRAAPAQEVVLPANIQAFTEAPIYARTNGYLKSWTVDIGARCIAAPSRITPQASNAAPSTVIFTVLAGVPAFWAAAVAV